MEIMKVKADFICGAIQSGKEELSVPAFSINLESRYHRDGLRIIKE